MAVMLRRFCQALSYIKVSLKKFVRSALTDMLYQQIITLPDPQTQWNSRQKKALA